MKLAKPAGADQMQHEVWPQATALIVATNCKSANQGV
jgi:hypothetical protein